MQKTGTLKVVASTGGLRFFGDADNIEGEATGFVLLQGFQCLKKPPPETSRAANVGPTPLFG